ncbi:MAG TPA: tetratricopeptide repeat protein, partial [Labilithrix sp.]
MLKVECESCKAPYQVDERRVPPTGLKMRCPKCGHTFLVTDPSKGAAPSAPGAPPKPGGPVKRPTMVGVGIPGAGGAAPPVPAPPPVAPQDDGLALPAVKPAAPKPAVPKPPPPMAAKPAPPPPGPPPPMALPGLDDLDLPALAGDVGLPAAVNRPANKPSAKGLSFDMDLPGQAPPPAPGGGGFGGVDLPSPKTGGGGFGSVDLPQAKRGGGFGSVDLPSPKGGFSDLPSLQNDLPVVGGSLPMPVHGGGLPVAVHGGGLPMPVHGGGLPSPKGGFGEIDLPSLQNDLPQPTAAGQHLPMPVSDDRLLPNRPGGGGGPPPVSFGELDLPLVGAGGGAPAPGGGPGGGVSFGELDLPADPSVAMASPMGGGGMGHAAAAPGGMAFGEVDLGGGPNDVQVVGPPPATSAGSFAFQEASLDAGNKDRAPTMTRQRRETYSGGGSRLPKIIALVALVVVAGGAALELTPVGAFGRNALSDYLHQGEWAKTAGQLADAARKKLDVDTYATSTQACDDLGESRKKSPRNRPLSAYTAFCEFATEARFGGDAARHGRAKTYIGDIPAEKTVPYHQAALAAELAANGEWDKARTAIDVAMQHEPKDGIQIDLQLLKGESALAMKDSGAALQAFTDANKQSPSARAQFGIARAQYMAKNLAKAKDPIEQTLKASPTHAGAHTMRALLAWELQRDDTSAIKDLAPVLDEKARKGEGPSEVSMALAAKGWIMLARDRAGEARAAFDEAVKIDPRNVSALVGQGEVLYADSRYTEALTRFDEAVAKDPTNIPATIGDAKTKIALERLADAKAQLGEARKRAPKDMGVALWLAKAEENLGNRSVAEQLYKQSLDLADPTNPDAINAYAAYASFLAGQGRTPEAQAALDQARAKLPDSAQLQRAFGKVASAQGHFDEAIGHFESALQKNPNDLGTRFELGQTYRRMHKLDLATQQLDMVAAVDKEYPNIALERGLVFEQSGDVQKALEQFSSAFQKAPNDVDLMLRVGAAYVAIGEIDKALPLLEKVRAQRPNSAEANHFTGRAYLKKGGLEQASAMKYLQRAVELDPNRAEYHLYVAWAANEASPSQLALAQQAVDKALQLDRLLADAYWQRGIVELRTSAVNDAIKDLKRALELKPSRFEAHATLAEALMAKNDTAGALQ